MSMPGASSGSSSSPTSIFSADPSQCLLLQVGESILCVNCERPLATAVIDCFGGLTGQSTPVTEHGERIDNTLLCRHCPRGVGGALPRADPAPVPCVWFIQLKKAPRLLVQSGKWIGWRELGGE